MSTDYIEDRTERFEGQVYPRIKPRVNSKYSPIKEDEKYKAQKEQQCLK